MEITIHNVPLMCLREKIAGYTALFDVKPDVFV